ncbi:hypothetical protein [Nostoc sp. UHCC 0252]|uniref:hypothetical protein n=1 Tax=Nostoc sp. UHCC 0252 TaxID=3110241 RepID=UPI002B21B263|nr:hypothetical protein [Nostoc sp. UHCC 0252]MEA5602513.1 hypothetical protein [Nostoc sp. UHCC 0252]
MTGLNLNKVKFTKKSDVVNPGTEIFNTSNVNTLNGNDQIIGTSNVTGDFALGAFVGIGNKNSNAIASADLSGQSNIAIYGIKNQGIINTGKGADLVNGTATAKITATAYTVSQAIAIAEKTGATAIANAFASIKIKTTADGIDNSGGVAYTGKGDDSISSDTLGSISAVAVAIADASAIVEAICKTPISQGLTAFAGAIATSLAQATITATGIKNIRGTIATGAGSDTLKASATSSAGTFAGTYSSTFASATPDNQALALAVVNASAEAYDSAIAIDNTRGLISTGNGNDAIHATASASDKAIAIDNTKGSINTGHGNDTIIAKATGLESYGIFGGTIDMGNGNDRISASSFGGGVNINMEKGDDFVQGFGNAKVDGGKGYDILDLGAYNKDSFQVSFGANNSVIFQLDSITMTTNGFEQFNFANNVSYTYNQNAFLPQ